MRLRVNHDGGRNTLHGKTCKIELDPGCVYSDYSADPPRLVIVMDDSESNRLFVYSDEVTVAIEEEP